MLKFFLLLFLTAQLIQANKLADNDKVEVYATSMDTKNNIVKANGDVVVIYKDYHLSAQRAVYNRNTGVLELYDNVRATKGENIKLLGDYAKLDISKKERSFKPFYMVEKKSNVWISGCESYAKDVEVKIKSGVMSGCDPNDPLWTMEFTSADYNTETMWLDIYNARIYIYDIPVFYTPYFGYSLDTTRRTGVLPPTVGFSDDEGLYYQQSLYIAESNWWDLEITPQMRTNRGQGVNSTFRFVDSKVSKGSISGGYFKEKSDYVEDKELANDTHYGFNLDYENNDVINQWLGTDLEGQSGLYADINDMNDVEYINLATNDTTQTITATQVISRVNLFYNEEDNYFGSYLKYYKDLELDNNDKTIQNLPALHYHRYLDTVLDDHLIYSFDVLSNNYYRTDGKKAVQTDFKIPITVQTSLFDEHMNISYEANLYGQNSSFSGNDDGLAANEKFDDGYYARNYHTFSASSQLTKAYDDLSHALDFGTQYIMSGDDFKDGYYDDQEDFCAQKANKSKPICEYYNVSDVEERLQFYFSQYIYDDTGKEIIYHRVTQNFYYKENVDDYSIVENELDYAITDNINFYNNMFYNFDENAFAKNFNRISFHNKELNLGFGHMYEDSFIPSTINTNQHTSFITSSIAYKYDKHYSYNFSLDYDYQKKEKKTTTVGFLYQKRCWDFGLKYVENNRPTLDINNNPSSIYDRFIYVTVAFKPIMKSGSDSSSFIYKLPDDGR